MQCCLTDEAKGSFGETFHSKTVVRTGVLGINYWIEVRMEREEEHLGRQMERKKKVLLLYTGKTPTFQSQNVVLW